MLFLLAALSTCDPGDILETIAAAKQANVRVSVVGLAADVFICEKIAKVCLSGCKATRRGLLTVCGLVCSCASLHTPSCWWGPGVTWSCG